MKVKLLTFHRAINYGALLQCYALQKSFSKHIDCEVIDYRSSMIENRYKLIKGSNNFKQFIKKLLQFKSLCVKKKKFRAFINKNIKLTKKYADFESLMAEDWLEEDVFCVGSDQVWNLDLTGKDNTFFLGFVPPKCKKNSYAASIAVELDEENQSYFKENLSDFEFVSVREKTALKSLENIGISCIQSIDPVFLLEKKEWENIALEKTTFKPYVLVYFLQKDEEFLEAAVKYAEQRGLGVIIISTGLRRAVKAKYITDCGPEEFVSYIMNANTIFTNSFHGIAFSILLEKDFYFNIQGNSAKTNSRIYDIIELFGLESRQFKGCLASDNIEYKKIRQLISKERDISKKYLRSMIE